MKRTKTIYLAALAVFLSPVAANAVVIDFGPSSAGGSGPLISFDDLVTPTGISGDATITVTVNGDLNWSGEYAQVMLDTLSLGTILNSNPGDDPFNFSGNTDVGNQSASDLTGTAIISNASFAPLIADGLLTLSFQFSPYVDCCGTVRTLYGSIEFEERTVPEPGTLALLGLGLVGMAARRRKTV